MRIGIFGASGFSSEVADIASVLGYDEICFIDMAPTATEFSGHSLVSEARVQELQSSGYEFAIGVGDNRLRAKIAQRFAGLTFPNLVHPAASFGRGQRQALEQRKGNIVTAGVRFTNNIRPGDFGIFNLNCTIGHDGWIEDFVNVAPGVNVSGNVHLKAGCYLGTGASILQGASVEAKLVIGVYSTVGAGAVVVKDVPDGQVVKGVPAR